MNAHLIHMQHFTVDSNLNPDFLIRCAHSPHNPLTGVCSVVSFQLAALGEGLHAGGAVEDSGFLGAG